MVKVIENLKMEIQLAVMSLLPPTVSKFLLMIGILSNKDGKYFYNQDSPKLFHMSKDDCDIALQTLIDNGLVDVTNIGNETFGILINYGRFKDFDFTLDELIDKDKQIQQFINENCTFCGTQSCVCYLNIADEEAISNCDNYHGEIPGIPKIKSLTEQFEDWMRETNTTWDDIRKKLAENKLKRE